MARSQLLAFFGLVCLTPAGLRGADATLRQGLALSASALPASDWPAYRRDGGLSGYSPLVGGLTQPPRIRWTFDLGGAMVSSEQVQLVDVNGDSHDELLRVLADRIICQSVSGDLLWETEILAEPRVTQIRDFAGDGTRGLLVDTNTGVEQRRYMVSGTTGEAVFLYACRNVFGRYERFGKILPSVPGEQLCAWWSGDSEKRFGADGAVAAGYLWSFEHGLESPHLRFQAFEEGTIYAPLHLFADMNGDGATDMVMISHEQMWVFDLASGAKIMQTGWPPHIRTYWAATAAMPLQPGELPSLLMINPMIPGVQVVSHDGKSAHRRWKQVVGTLEDQYQSQVKIDRAAPDPFVDLDGDGEIEILAEVTNEHGDQRPHLVIFAASDGRRVYDQPDQSVLTVDNLDGKDPPEILIKEGMETLRICQWTGASFVDRWRGRGVEPLVRPAPPEGHLARAVGARTTGINMPLWREADGSELFLLRFSDGVFACRLVESSLDRVRAVVAHEAIASQPAPHDYTWDGQTLAIEKVGRPRVTFEVPRRQAYLPDPPLAGRMGDARRLVMREYAGAIISLTPDGSDRRVLVAHTPTAKGACITDLDGDGRAELLTLATTDAGRTAIVAVTAKGVEQLHIEPPKGATEVMLGPTGSLGAGQGRWIVARYQIPYENARVVAYDGRTGAPLWMRDYLGPEHTAATKFALHLPTAVHDIDGDGADDLVASSENWYEVISVKDNRTVTPNTTITAAVPGHWGAYATPLLADFLGDGNPLVFHNNAYALSLLTRPDGTPVWHYGLTRDTTHASKAGIGDLDGDGRIEIATTQADGLIRVFDARPHSAMCPTCPADQPLSAANHTGHVRWTYQLPPPLSDFATLDADGDARSELLCGAGDGKLYALEEIDGAEGILWTVDLGSPVGSPIVADLDGDQKPEIIVTTADGRIHCLGSAEISKRP